MIQSMTGFASETGAAEGAAWLWELRGVNGKGLDLRLRLPEGIPGLEPAARAALTAGVTRGNVTAGLRLTRETAEGTLAVNPAQAARVVAAFLEVETQAADAGLSIAPARAVDILAQRGVLEERREERDSIVLLGPIIESLSRALEAFSAMRASEGAALHRVIDAQLSAISTQIDAAAKAAQARGDSVRENLKAALSRVTDTTDVVSDDRLTQELALIAVKGDVTEEIDRLRAHVGAARDLLDEAGAVGRKLDFLAQEFNREANTLCAKAGDPALTRIGLDLKATIDQMREQIQNVE